MAGKSACEITTFHEVALLPGQTKDLLARRAVSTLKPHYNGVFLLRINLDPLALKMSRCQDLLRIARSASGELDCSCPCTSASPTKPLPQKIDLSHNLNPFKGVYVRDYIGDYGRGS